jgi:ankyrin repeat protein
MEQGDPETGAELLKQHPGLLEERNGLGETVLHFLAVENNQPAVAWLHEQGADVNVTNAFGTPVLFEVAQLGYRDLFLWLVQHGADPNRRGKDGQSMEDYLLEFGKAEMLRLIKEQVTLR